MARNSLKTFSKVFSLNNGETSSITLANTAGSAIMCNYLAVDSRSIDNNDLGYYHLYPVGIYQGNPPANGTSATESTSGAGGVCGVADGSVEYLVPNKLGVSSVQLTNNLGGVGTFVLRYGVLTDANILVDNMIVKSNGTKEN